MIKSVIKKRTRNFIYYYFPFGRSCIKFNVFSRTIIYSGRHCVLSRCINSNITCKFCFYCEK